MLEVCVAFCCNVIWVGLLALLANGYVVRHVNYLLLKHLIHSHKTRFPKSLRGLRSQPFCYWCVQEFKAQKGIGTCPPHSPFPDISLDHCLTLSPFTILAICLYLGIARLFNLLTFLFMCICAIQRVMTDDIRSTLLLNSLCRFEKLPDHLLVEILIRVPVIEWGQISHVSRRWASLFQEECLWHAAVCRSFPVAGNAKRWPGPIPQGLSKRRYAALYVSKHIFSLDGALDEIVGHAYLFLKDQLKLSNMPPTSGILHGTIIDQFIACGIPRDKAHDFASEIWLAVIDNLEENEQTFVILKRLALEGDVFLPYPYSRPYKVLWKVFEKLFTDFRDCFSHMDYCDVLGCAKQHFQPIPATWLGY